MSGTVDDSSTVCGLYPSRSPHHPITTIGMVRFLSSAQIEEAIPMAVSGAARLAPQELYRPSKQPVKGATELSATDRNRRRRQLKMVRRSQARQTEERARTLARLDPRKQGALDKRDALKMLSKNKSVTILPTRRQQQQQQKSQPHRPRAPRKSGN